MKKFFVFVIAGSSLLIAACNNSAEKKDEHAGHEMEKTKDTAAPASAKESANINAINATFTNVDPKVRTALDEVNQHYLHVEFALTNDDAPEAALGGKAMSEALAKVDQATMTAEQKTLFNENQEDLKEHAEHISKNAGKIEHQREHFEKMSEDVYNLVKGFGSSKSMYKTFCPMAFDNKGAFWLSASTDVKNPYFGKKMVTCGEVQEVIK